MKTCKSIKRLIELGLQLTSEGKPDFAALRTRLGRRPGDRGEPAPAATLMIFDARRGRVVSPPGVDVDFWRAEIRAQARAEKICVADAEVRAGLARAERLRALAADARMHLHELGPWLR